MISIVYKCEDFVVINKPCGVPSQKDNSGDPDSITLCEKMLSSLGESGELHIINRLDRVVGGMVLLARSSSSAAELSTRLADGIEKEYFAVVEGAPTDGVMRDFIYKDATLGRAYVFKDARRGAKEAVLEYFVLSTAEYKGKTLSLVRVKLKTGRFHQIRAQFSSRKMPLIGDKKYGSKVVGTIHPALFSARLAFELGEKKYDFNLAPDCTEFPWSLFDKKNFEVNV